MAARFKDKKPADVASSIDTALQQMDRDEPIDIFVAIRPAPVAEADFEF